MSRKCEPGCTCSRHKRTKWTDEQRAGARAAQKCEPGCTCARHKRVMTPEHKANIAAANAARKGESRPCPEGCTCAKHKGYHFGGSKPGRVFSPRAKENIAQAAQERERSDEELRVLSDRMKANHADPEWEARRIEALIAVASVCEEDCECGKHSEEARLKVATARTGTTQSPETRAKIAATLRQKLLDGTWAPGKTFPAPYIRDDVLIIMRSPWEVRFAEAMDRHGVRWEYEPERFDLGWSTYAPDFYVPALDRWIEVKGWLRERAAMKMVSFQGEGRALTMVTYHESPRGLVLPVPPSIVAVCGELDVERFLADEMAPV